MNDEYLLNEPWLKWAKEIQSIAQCGLAYCQNVYDIERFEQLRDIAAEMLSFKTGISTEKVKDLFCGETGYQTPKIDTRAAIIENGKILLVQEKSGKWAMPGGWCDVMQTVASNTVKEAREEAGAEVEPLRIVMLHDQGIHNRPVNAYNICKVFILCRWLSGTFQPNSETIAADWFSPDELPEPLAVGKTTKEQIDLCFQAYADPNWQTRFD